MASQRVPTSNSRSQFADRMSMGDIVHELDCLSITSELKDQRACDAFIDDVLSRTAKFSGASAVALERTWAYLRGFMSTLARGLRKCPFTASERSTRFIQELYRQIRSRPFFFALAEMRFEGATAQLASYLRQEHAQACALFQEIERSPLQTFDVSDVFKGLTRESKERRIAPNPLFVSHQSAFKPVAIRVESKLPTRKVIHPSREMDDVSIRSLLCASELAALHMISSSALSTTGPCACRVRPGIS